MVSPSRLRVETANLVWRAASDSPLENDFRDISKADLIVFQNNEALDSPRTNQRLSEYEQYTRQHFGDAPTKLVNGLGISGVGPNRR